MPATEGFTQIDQAEQKWGRSRNWWYTQVREGNVTGYKIPGERGTFLKDVEVEEFLKPKPIDRGRDGQTG